jgi:hypothetical protein
MGPLRFPLMSRRCLAWLVWLGLLLPLAQVSAAAHALSHARTEVGRDAKQAPQAGHCDLCLLGAAVGGGAPPAKAAPLPPVAAGHEVFRAACADVCSAVPAQPYRSRAPPDASR